MHAIIALVHCFSDRPICASDTGDRALVPQEPPFALFDGKGRPKDMMYFLQKHATHRFELPPNPHLSREQHTMWKEQVAELPAEKVEAAYQSLERETGLARDEL